MTSPLSPSNGPQTALDPALTSITATSVAAAATIPGNVPAANRPDYQRPEYVAGQAARNLCHALMAGTAGVRGLGETGLPKWPNEKREHYKIRATGSQVARYYARTVQASVGMICSTPPTLADDANALIKADWEDIDCAGTHGEVFAKRVADAAINGGFCGILVDAPPIPAGTKLMLADEQALGLRPFWVLVPADHVISWIVDVPNWALLLASWAAGLLTAEQVKSYAKHTVVRQLVLHEPTDVAAGPYGVSCVDRYRILRLTDAGVTFEVWEKRAPDATSGAGEYFARVASGAQLGAKQTPMTEIPFAVVYGGRKSAPFVAEPPLLSLAELNLDHYQVTADRRYLMRLCHAPTLFLAGIDPGVDETGRPKEIHVGPNSVITAPDPQAKADYVAANPAALNSSKEEREEMVRQMAVLGMSFIGKDRRGQAETATGRALDDAAENATHATVARGLQDGFEQALKYHALYRGVDAPEITVNTTYASPQVDPQIGLILWNAVAAGQLDIGSLIEYLSTGALPDDVDIRIDTLQQLAKAKAESDAKDAVIAAADAEKSGDRPADGGTADDGVRADAVSGPAMTEK